MTVWHLGGVRLTNVAIFTIIIGLVLWAVIALWLRRSKQGLALRSIGVGGHISTTDTTLFDSPYRQAMFREVDEEVLLTTKYTERCVGLINDDSTPVGQVHLGIVHVFDLEEPKVERREQALTRAGFAPLAELREQRSEFETWSQFLLDQDF